MQHQPEDWGWGPPFTEAFAALDCPEAVPVRVVRAIRGHYTVVGHPDCHEARLTGKARQEAEFTQVWPVVGDWLAVTPEDGETGRIEAVLPRQGAFARKAPGEVTREQVVVANVDTVFLVSGLDGDYNPRRIERYLTLAWESGASPVIVLNKADRATDRAAIDLEIQSIALGTPVVFTEATSADGIEPLRPYLKPGKTHALLGSSGVGKSTLTNRLLGEDVLATQSVREDDSRGRHTTTHRELFRLPDGALLIDTPGMRELQLWSDGEGVEQTFEDITGLAEGCRFRDCNHEDEPGCAVREAVETGALDAGRLTSYHKLQREVAYLERRQDPRASQNSKARWKAINKEIRRIYKDREK
jgi:ribosome biogenesis GTPase